MKAFPGSSVKSEHPHDLLDEGATYNVSETMDTLMLAGKVIVPAGPVGLEEESSSVRTYRLSSLRSAANHEERSRSAASSTSSGSPLSMIGWTSDAEALDNPTPASSVYSKVSLSIDPRLLNESNPQPIVLSP
ncbi:MAG: hypothetical protein Q9217_000165 [Psora testacea]